MSDVGLHSLFYEFTFPVLMCLCLWDRAKHENEIAFVFTIWLSGAQVMFFLPNYGSMDYNSCLQCAA